MAASDCCQLQEGKDKVKFCCFEVWSWSFAEFDVLEGHDRPPYNLSFVLMIFFCHWIIINYEPLKLREEFNLMFTLLENCCRRQIILAFFSCYLLQWWGAWPTGLLSSLQPNIWSAWFILSQECRNWVVHESLNYAFSVYEALLQK